MFDDNSSSKKGSIADLGDVVGGATPSKNIKEFFCRNGIVWLTPKDLTSTGYKFIFKGETDITDAAYRSCSAKLMPVGTVLLTSRAPVGTVAIAMTEMCTNQGFKSIIPKPEIGTPFVYYFLKENKKLLESHASGTTFMEVSGNELKGIPVRVPDKKGTAKFNAFCEPLFKLQEQNEAEIVSLENLQQTLIRKISRR